MEKREQRRAWCHQAEGEAKRSVCLLKEEARELWGRMMSERVTAEGRNTRARESESTPKASFFCAAASPKVNLGGIGGRSDV